jgi:hypothetical protein
MLLAPSLNTYSGEGQIIFTKNAKFSKNFKKCAKFFKIFPKSPE